MNLKNRITKNALLLLAFVIAISSCQKIEHPALPSDYPKDSNPPGGPLKFYVAMDGTSVDSVRANFGTENNVTYVDGGISGKAYQGSPTSYIKYGKPNDFTNSTSFTISFWIKKTPQPAGSGTNLAFSYDGTNSHLVSYIDGVLFKTNTVGTLGPVNFGDYSDFTIGGPDQYTHDKNTWMGFFDGQIDQFRLYGTVLSPADIAALYANK